MGYPPRASGTDRPALITRDELPPGTFMEPRRTQAELLYVDGTWRRVTVLGWLRLGVTIKQPITNRWIFWLVHLRLETGEEAWFEYDSRDLRPKASSSSASGT